MGLDVVQIANKRHYELKLDRTRWLFLEPLQPKITGIGFPGFDESRSVEDNLKAIYGKLPDVVDLYHPEEYHGVADLPCVTTIQNNEVKPKVWKPRVKGARPDLIVFRHANDLDNWIDSIHNWGLEAVHIPHVAPQHIFYQRDVNLEWDFVTVGAFGGKIYPLRTVLHKAGQLLAKRGYRYTNYNHPGNELKDATDGWHLHQFAKMISSARIVGTSASSYAYRLGKYVEIPACGTALAADRPAAREDMPHLIEIARDATPEQVANQLEAILKSGQDEWHAQKGLEYAQQFTVDYYAREYEKAVKELL